MRNSLLAALTAVALYGAGLGGAAGQNSNDGKNRWMMVKNESPFTAYQIYIVPSGRDCCWSRDLLEVEVIPPRGKASEEGQGEILKNPLYVNFDDGSNECIFDIRIATPPRIEYRGWDWFLSGVDVCSARPEDRVITLEGKLPGSKDDAKNRWVRVENNSWLTAFNIYIIPSWKKDAPSQRNDCCWSHDLLDKHIIGSRSWRNVNFDNGSGECTFDIRITSDKKDTDWYLDGVNVCKAEKITLKQKPSDGKRREVMIKNESRVDAINVFSIPENEKCCWSGDLLGNKIIIRRKESLRVDFDVGTNQCKFEYRITKSDNSRDWTDKIDVCSEPTVPDIPAITLK